MGTTEHFEPQNIPPLPTHLHRRLLLDYIPTELKVKKKHRSIEIYHEELIASEQNQLLSSYLKNFSVKTSSEKYVGAKLS